jgi:hypothetical protein
MIIAPPVPSATQEDLRVRVLTDPELREIIGRRAYELYELRGGQSGRELDDWLQAECEVLFTLTTKFAASGNSLPINTPEASPMPPSRRRDKCAMARTGGVQPAL